MQLHLRATACSPAAVLRAGPSAFAGPDWLPPSPPTGPKEKLDTTAVSQPAIYVASLAAVEKIRATEGQVGTCAALRGQPAGALLVHC